MGPHVQVGEGQDGTVVKGGGGFFRSREGEVVDDEEENVAEDEKGRRIGRAERQLCFDQFSMEKKEVDNSVRGISEVEALDGEEKMVGDDVRSRPVALEAAAERRRTRLDMLSRSWENGKKTGG